MHSDEVVISCFNDGNPPIGFKWTSILLDKFEKRHYKITLVLHGDCLKYSLRSSKYPDGNKNPYKNLLKIYTDYGVHIVVCELCLNELGYTNKDILSFVKPIPFSIDFIIQKQVQCNAVIIYDS